MTTTVKEAQVIVDKEVPLVRIIREFDAPVERVFRAHMDPDLFVQWVGPDRNSVTIDRWDARTGGSYRYIIGREGMEAGFNGVIHEVRENALVVQTFSWEGMPDGVALEKSYFEELPGGRTRLTTTSLVDSFADRDAFVASGMESGVQEGYRKLDALLAGSRSTRTSGARLGLARAGGETCPVPRSRHAHG